MGRCLRRHHILCSPRLLRIRENCVPPALKGREEGKEGRRTKPWYWTQMMSRTSTKHSYTEFCNWCVMR